MDHIKVLKNAISVLKALNEDIEKHCNCPNWGRQENGHFSSCGHCWYCRMTDYYPNCIESLCIDIEKILEYEEMKKRNEPEEEMSDGIQHRRS